MARIKFNDETRPVTALYSEMETAREFGLRPAEVRAWPRAERKAAGYYLLLRQHYQAEAVRRAERQAGPKVQGRPW